MNIIVTPAAEKFMRRMVRFNGATPGSGFRLTVTAGGCSGLAAEFTVESSPAPGDARLAVGDLNVFLPVESRLLLDGVTVDFSDTPLQSGLTFINPNAANCGCSTTTGVDSASRPASVSAAAIQRR
jgi:iron-sulfur cluster assembly accessory protein